MLDIFPNRESERKNDENSGENEYNNEYSEEKNRDEKNEEDTYYIKLLHNDDYLSMSNKSCVVYYNKFNELEKILKQKEWSIDDFTKISCMFDKKIIVKNKELIKKIIKFNKNLGAGTYGSVFGIKAKNKRFAVKTITDGRHIYREVYAYSLINKVIEKYNIPNFIYFFALVENKIVLDFIGRKSENIYTNDPFIEDREKQIFLIIIQIICALSVAHMECGFIHNDLHHGNILIQKIPLNYIYTLENGKKVHIECDYTARIIDYGLSNVKNDYDSVIDSLNTSIKLNNPSYDICQLLVGFLKCGCDEMIEGLLYGLLYKKYGESYDELIQYHDRTNYYFNLFSAYKNTQIHKENYGEILNELLNGDNLEEFPERYEIYKKYIEYIEFV